MKRREKPEPLPASHLARVIAIAAELARKSGKSLGECVPEAKTIARSEVEA